MQTPERSMSALELIVGYLRQRARLRLFVPLSIVLALMARWIVPASSVPIGAIATAALQALALTVAFRVWDDIEDRDIDRVRDPARVTVTASSTLPLTSLGLTLSSAAVASLMAEPFALRRLAAVSIATAILSVWYGVRPGDGSRHALGEHILAVKYPLFAYAIAPELPSDVVTIRATVIFAALYVLICIYEYADDVELRQLFTSRRAAS